jgi:hypothetical protein
MNSNFEDNFVQQLSIDCVIFGYGDGQLKVLVSKLKLNGDFWVLPSGFILKSEGIDRAATRILQERTGLKDIYLDQYRIFGDMERSNKDVLAEIQRLNPGLFDGSSQQKNDLEWLANRFIAIGYYALVDINKVVPKLMSIDQSIDWYPVNSIPQLILDHNQQVQHALEALRMHLDDRLLGFNLLPEKFTMKALQELYEAVYDKPFRRNNFQKKILDLDVLERLEKQFTGASNKAPYLYRFKNYTQQRT